MNNEDMHGMNSLSSRQPPAPRNHGPSSRSSHRGCCPRRPHLSHMRLCNSSIPGPPALVCATAPTPWLLKRYRRCDIRGSFPACNLGLGLGVGVGVGVCVGRSSGAGSILTSRLRRHGDLPARSNFSWRHPRRLLPLLMFGHTIRVLEQCPRTLNVT